MSRASKLLALSAVVALSGCAAVASPVMGMWYTDVQGPITASGSQGTKSGESCAASILGLVATGDASIEAARKAGNITNVTAVDHHSTSILGFYSKFCTIVRGN